MKKVILYKNNKIINLDPNTIIFDQKNLLITKKELEYEIKLDFLNKKCFFILKKENVTFPIEILEMNYYNHKNKWNFNYEIESEEKVKNTLKIEL